MSRFNLDELTKRVSALGSHTLEGKWWHQGHPNKPFLFCPDPSIGPGRYHRAGGQGAWYASSSMRASWEPTDFAAYPRSLAVFHGFPAPTCQFISRPSDKGVAENGGKIKKGTYRKDSRNSALRGAEVWRSKLSACAVETDFIGPDYFHPFLWTSYVGLYRL